MLAFSKFFIDRSFNILLIYGLQDSVIDSIFSFIFESIVVVVANIIYINQIKICQSKINNYCRNPYLKGVCASSNPPSVLYEISLSGQPEPVQVHVTLFGLAPLRSSVSF